MSQQINLYSPLFRKQQKVFSALAMLQATGLLVVVLVVFSLYIALQGPLLEARQRDSAQQLKSELERLKLLAARESPEVRAKALAERRKALEAALAEQAKSLQTLRSGSLGRSDGYAEALRALARLSVDGVWLTRVQFSESGGQLSLFGRALRPEMVPSYLERLRAAAALQAQDFARIEITRGVPAQSPAGSPAAAPVAFVDFMVSSEAGDGK